LEAPARVRPEVPEKQLEAYTEIRQTIDTLKELERIHLDERAGIYIYEIIHRDYRQTGVWALTAVQDFLDGRIKLHEQTLADSERRISNYRKYTGLEGSPILLTYPPNATINRIIAETCKTQRKSTVGNKKGLHRIWKIEDKQSVDELVKAFAQIEPAFLADGHHRLAATAGHNPDSSISSLYIAADQLRIIDYHRVVIPELPIHKDYLLKRLAEICEVIPNSNKRNKNSIGMQLQGQWYELLFKDEALDVVTLQDKILAPLFGITDPRTDTRLKCVGGENAMDEINAILKLHPEAIAFTLQPMTVYDLMVAAAAGQILPPKSTWIDPKVPYGLLMYQHHFEGKDISAQHYD